MQRFFYYILFFLTLSSGLTAQTTRYVKAKATGAGNGSSWQDASEDLQGMINASSGNGDIVYVAAGTYRPRTAAFQAPFSRENSFRIEKNIEIYGGFPATGGDFAERDWVAHKTILSGDLYQNDHHGAQFNDDNSYHVLVTQGPSVNSECVIDGFTLTGGNADHPTAYSYQRGGGWYNAASGPTVRNLIVTGNKAEFGGGWYNDGGSPSVENVEIRSNRAYMGGGWFNSEVKPSIRSVRIWDNHAEANGGGVYIAYTTGLLLENLSIRGNTADRGGGLYQFEGTNMMVSSEVTGNVSKLGGAIYSVVAHLNLVNCTIAGNAAESGILFIANNYVTIFNTIIWGNNASNTLYPFDRYSYFYSLIEGLTYPDGAANLDANLNPLFVNLVLTPYHADPGLRQPTVQGDYTLLSASPVINKGHNAYLPTDWLPDLAGNQRVSDRVVDLGAFEYQLEEHQEVYVDSSAVPGGDGRSWQTALTSLADAVLMANSSEEIKTIHVAKGTYFPEDKTGTRPDNRDKSFFFHSSMVTVLGGYPSGGGIVRDWVSNKTILSGDIDRDGVLDDDNSLHVVILSQPKQTIGVTLDGLIIEHGNANQDGYYFTNQASLPVFNNSGGGIHGILSYMTLKNVVVRNNAANTGGGIYHYHGVGNIRNSVISDNVAQVGGGAYVIASSLNAVNVTVSGNLAGHSGGGWFMVDSGQYLINSIVTGNTANFEGDDFLGLERVANIQRSIIGKDLHDNGVVQSLGEVNILSPKTLRLVANSPAINAGIVLESLSDLEFDLAGKNRIIGSSIDIGAFEYDSNDPLPITLIDFNAVRAERQTLLTWSTASEINASHFEIERSFDAKSWRMVGSQNVKSKEDNNTGDRNYSHTDDMNAIPGDFAGILYYRLRMVDEDRTFSYSTVRSVRVEDKGNNAKVRVYPNPTASGLIKVDFVAGETAHIKVLDLMGREVVPSQSFEGSVPLDLSRLPKGIYMLHVRGLLISEVKKIVVE